MDSFTKEIFDFMKSNGADMVGAADLTGLPEEARSGMPRAISMAMVLPKEIIRGISNLPTREYFDSYCRCNDKLDELAETGAELIVSRGFQALPMIRYEISATIVDNSSKLPLKTLATNAGLGWIGKCALLVTEPYGSMLRFGGILTDAPLECGKAVTESKCGNCNACKDACPGGAISGKLWEKDMPREDFFDAAACRTAAEERSKLGFGIDKASICGKCIEVCPWTRRYCDNPL